MRYFTTTVQMQPGPVAPQSIPVAAFWHVRPAQQATVSHAWPISAHKPASTPPSGGGVLILLQVPLSAPGGMMQVTPAQQSPVVVQGPPSGTQLPPSVPTPHLSWPVASGTQGTPPQHSPLNEQLPPA